MKRLDSNITFVAITVCDDAVLLLKRNTEPLCWGPPSGHLKVGESIEMAIEREMNEEIGQGCEILMAVGTWQGIHRGRSVLSITYVCQVKCQAVVLSEEHSAYLWIPLTQINEYKDLTILNLEDWPLLVELARSYASRRKK